MSRLYTGSGRAFQEVTSAPLDGEALVDIERRVKLQPHFLGEPLVVFADAADFPGFDGNPGGRCLAGADAAGRTVAVSLNLGDADVGALDTVLQMAAALQSMPAETLERTARAFIDRPENAELRRMWEELDVEMEEGEVGFPSLLAVVFEKDADDFAAGVNRGQRLLIAAEGFTPRLLGVMRWLSRSGVGATGLRYRKFEVGGQEVFFVERMPAEAESPTEVSVASEPWKTDGRAYHAARLLPDAARLLDDLLLAVQANTFALSWSGKYSFWIRGPRRHFRVRTWYRDRLEVGFHNAAPAAAADFLAPYGLGDVEVSSVGGYADSPFVTLEASARIDERWTAMLNDWLSGSPSRSRDKQG